MWTRKEAVILAVICLTFSFLDCVVASEKQVNNETTVIQANTFQSWNDNQRKLNVLILTIPASGHTSIPLALGEELVRRGHRVTLSTSGNKHQTAAENVGITFKSIGPSDDFVRLTQAVGKHIGLAQVMTGMLKNVPKMKKLILKEGEQFMNMIQNETESGNHWDVVLSTDFLMALVQCVGDSLNIPAILLGTTAQIYPHTYPPWPWASSLTGGTTDDMTFMRRFVNAIERVLVPGLLSFILVSSTKSTTDVFCPTLTSTHLANGPAVYMPHIVPTAIGFEYPRTMTPLTHYVGPIQSETPDPCSDELESWLNNKSDKSVVYISMGSLLSVSKQMAEALVEGIKKTNYSVVWAMRKTDDFELDVDQERFFISDWLPQLSVLRHRATGIAILHGGANGVHESLHSGVPVIALPAMTEQIANAGRVHHHRLGIHLNRDTLTADQITQSIREIDSGDYRENVHKLQKMFAQAGGVKKAADLVEFYAEVGYDHLIPAYAKYQWTWIQYYNADVYTLLLACALITVYFWFRVMKCVWSRCCASKKQKAD